MKPHYFNTFDEVKNWYDAIVPVRGPQNAGKDLRPIAERYRKFERIVKVDENCYALTDYYHCGDPEATWMSAVGGVCYPATVQDLADWAPIVWRKQLDGSETITIRNAGRWNNSVHSRHRFINRFSPRKMHITNDRKGRHFVFVAGKRYYIPPTRGVRSVLYDFGHLSNVTRGPDCGGTLTFLREGNSFALVGAPKPMPVVRADREARAALKPKIDEFLGWVHIVAPILFDPRDYKARSDAQTAMGYHRKKLAKPEKIMEALQDPEHENRIHLLHLLCCAEYYAGGKPRTEEPMNPERLRKLLLKSCDFTRIEWRLP